MKKATAVYFSPTGGSRRAAELLLSLVPAEEKRSVDCTLPGQREKIYEFATDELVIVANPVYAGQLPPVTGLWENLRGHHTPCIILGCYGNRAYEDTLAQMQKRLQRQGFIVVGAAAPVIPHIFAPALGANRPDRRDAQELALLAAAVARKLPAKDYAAVSVPGNTEPEPKKPIPVPMSIAKERCTGCGACAHLCPTGAIAAGTWERNQEYCISCMRCVRRCPAQARSFEGDKIRAWLEGNFSEPQKLVWFA